MDTVWTIVLVVAGIALAVFLLYFLFLAAVMAFGLLLHTGSSVADLVRMLLRPERDEKGEAIVKLSRLKTALGAVVVGLIGLFVMYYMFFKQP